MNLITFFVEGLCLVVLLISIYLINPRRRRRLFQERVKYMRKDDSGHDISDYGYIIQWCVKIKEIEHMKAIGTDIKKAKTAMVKREVEIETIHRAFVIIESEKAPYIKSFCESRFVDFFPGNKFA